MSEHHRVHRAQPDDHHRESVRGPHRLARRLRRAARSGRVRVAHRQTVLDGPALLPALVTGTVIAIIGLSLIGADIGLIAGDKTSNFVPKVPVLAPDGHALVQGGKVVQTMNPDSGQVSHIALAAGVIVLIVAITRLFRAFISQTAVLISIVLGTLIAWPMGLLDFSSVSASRWFGMRRPSTSALRSSTPRRSSPCASWSW